MTPMIWSCCLSGAHRIERVVNPVLVIDTPEKAWILCDVVAHHTLARLRHPPANALPERDPKFVYLRRAGHDHVRQLLPHIVQ